jgi:hypothetical protein
LRQLEVNSKNLEGIKRGFKLPNQSPSNYLNSTSGNSDCGTFPATAMGLSAIFEELSVKGTDAI